MNWHVEKRLPWRTDPRTVRVIERLLRQWPLKEPPAGLKEACLKIAGGAGLQVEKAPRESDRRTMWPMRRSATPGFAPVSRAFAWGATAILLIGALWGLSWIQWSGVGGHGSGISGQWSDFGELSRAVVSGQKPAPAPSGTGGSPVSLDQYRPAACATSHASAAVPGRRESVGRIGAKPPARSVPQAIRRGENEPREITQAEVESILREFRRLAQEVQEVQRGVEQARAQAQALQATAEVAAQDIATVAQAAREVADTSKATAGVLLAYFFGETPSWCEGEASLAPGVTEPDVAPASSRQEEDGEEGAASGESPAMEPAPSEPNAMPNDASEAEAPAPGPEGPAGTPAAVESQSLAGPSAAPSDAGPTPGAADPQQSSMAPPAPVCAGPSPVGVSPRARLSAAPAPRA